MTDPSAQSSSSVVTPLTPVPPKTESWQALAAYKAMLQWLFVGTLVLITAMIVLLLVSRTTLIFAVILSGGLGAFFSALIRLYNFEELPKALVIKELQDLPKTHLLIYSLVPGVVGAIAAVVLYAAFAGKLVSGDLFPAFACDEVQKQCKSFASLFDDWTPDEAKDYAKVLVWGFIAGFAERLVPDTLQSLSRTVKQ